MVKSSRQLTWHGVDINLATSLIEKGLVVRYVSKKRNWQCIYRNECELDRFSYGWMNENDLKEMFISGWAQKKLYAFCSYLGVSWGEWLECPFAQRLSDVIDYFGSTDIFGLDYSGGESFDSICKTLKITSEQLLECA